MKFHPMTTLFVLGAQGFARLVTADLDKESSKPKDRRVENVQKPLVQFIKPHLAVLPELGESNIGEIVGGSEVSPPQKYPFMIAYDPLGCGGSLVAPNVMLTAAHCQGFISSVQIGRHDVSSSSETFESFTVLEEVPHPNYNSATTDYDFMMVRFNGNSAFTPVTLDSGGESLLADGTDLIVMGWGTTSSGGSGSSVLLEVEVDTDTSCGSYASSSITSRMFCAGRAGKDSCQGDSGGPIIHKSTGKLVGIASWGSGCANANFPGVYAKVSDQLTWIQTYITAWSTGTPVSSPTNSPVSTPVSSPISSPVSTTGCDWQCYLDNYPDLRSAFGDDQTAAAQHYTSLGQSEGRDCSCVCNWACYLARYPDLTSAFGSDQSAAAQHWRSDGQSEGRDCTCSA